MAQTQTIELLAGHFILQSLDRGELEQLAQRAHQARYPAEYCLFQKGDPGEGMLAVVSGRVRICSHSLDGKELVLNIINPGEVFGEIALIDELPRTADAVTMEPTELVVLHRRDFLPFLEQHPALCLKLLRVLTHRLRRTSEQLEEVVFLELPSRLAKRLLWLAGIFGRRTRDGTLIDIKLSQQQLGSLVGMTRESMNKQLRHWREEGVVALHDGLITIRQMDLLEEIAGAD